MMTDVWEEVDSISVIYSSPGEFNLHTPGDRDLEEMPSFQINLTTNNKIKFSADFTIPKGYPDQVPVVHISCDSVDRTGMSKVQTELKSFMQGHLSGAMLMEVIIWLQDNIDKYCAEDEKVKVTETDEKKPSDLEVALLRLDHMRDKKKYTRTLMRWTSELDLRGCIVFESKRIFIILQGLSDGIKEFVTRLRTQNVDVDSKGRSCKERMLDILSREKLNDECISSEFKVEECSDLKEVERLFKKCGIEHLFDTFVKC